MREITEAQILERLQVENPWWTTDQIPETYRTAKPRQYLKALLQLTREFDPVRAVIALGPRRVGKTWLLYHVIQALIQEGTHPTQLGYVSIDSPIYNQLSLEQLLKFLHEACTDIKGMRYVFFDEIQYLKDWERHLKRLVESYPTIKFVASGSAAAALKLKSRESGAGRFTDFFIPPLTFHEYLYLTEKERDLILDSETNSEKNDKCWQAGNINDLNDEFVNYLNFGGYPEALFSKNIQADPNRFIKSDIIDKVLLRDLPSLYGINDIQELNSLFTTLAYNTASEVAPGELSQKSGVAQNTIKKYIEYLEAAFLIKVVHRVDKNSKRFQRTRQFKVYLTNPSIRAALFSPVKITDSSLLGLLAETAIYAQWFHQPIPLYYARWGGGEVDIVSVQGHQPCWALEVKWSDRAAKKPHKELKNLIGFCKQNKIPTATCTTFSHRGQVDIDGVAIRFTPSSEYCYTVGRNLLSIAAYDNTDDVNQLPLPF